MRRKKTLGWVSLMILACCMIGLLAALLGSSGDNLPQYTEAPSTQMPTEPKILEMDYADYNAKQINMSVKIPSEWSHAVREGADVFVNPADGASISIGIYDYIPSVNMESAQTYENSVVSAGGVLYQFSKIDNSAYTVSYSISGIDTFEAVSWDLEHFLSVKIAIPSERYDYYIDTVKYLLDTVHWQKEAPLPNDTYIFYNEFGSFQFGVPSSWESEIIDGVFQSRNPDSGAYFTVSVETTDLDLASITQLDYLNAYGNGKSSYLLSTFSNTGTTLTAESTYEENGEMISCIHNIVVANGYMYEFQFLSRTETYDEDGLTYSRAISLFQFFNASLRNVKGNADKLIISW